MVFRPFGDAAPATVRNFKRLVREGFYDGLPSATAAKAGGGQWTLRLQGLIFS